LSRKTFPVLERQALALLAPQGVEEFYANLGRALERRLHLEVDCVVARWITPYRLVVPGASDRRSRREGDYRHTPTQVTRMGNPTMATVSSKELLLKEFAREMATTRTMLERVPFEKFDWVPHAKSTPLGRLAIHVATLPGMGANVIEKESLSFGGPRQPLEIKSSGDLVALFEKSAQTTRAAIEGTSDEHLGMPWRLEFKDKVIFEGPRIAALRALMMSHLIHHRAQLGVYLRLNDIPIPGSYGPSADEPTAR
jgi:uncharacterized damage-inducible protein DinB